MKSISYEKFADRFLAYPRCGEYFLEYRKRHGTLSVRFVKCTNTAGFLWLVYHDSSTFLLTGHFTINPDVHLSLFTDYGSNSDASANSKSRNTIMVVHKEGGLSTTNLIIIVVAVVVCLLIVVAAFLVKR